MWPEFDQLMSDGRFEILRLWKPFKWFRGMWEHIDIFEVFGNMSIEGK